MTEYISPEGLEKLKKELDYLKNIKRKEMAQRLQDCISCGDLSENSDYQDAKESQGFLEGRILELEELIRSAVVVSKAERKGIAQVGSVVLVSSCEKFSLLQTLRAKNKERFKLVGVEEANPLEGKISIESPLGKAMLNCSENNIVEVEAPNGKIYYKILKIE